MNAHEESMFAEALEIPDRQARAQGKTTSEKKSDAK
jgi:hypothetical protein